MVKHRNTTYNIKQRFSKLNFEFNGDKVSAKLAQSIPIDQSANTNHKLHGFNSFNADKCEINLDALNEKKIDLKKMAISSNKSERTRNTSPKRHIKIILIA